MQHTAQGNVRGGTNAFSSNTTARNTRHWTKMRFWLIPRTVANGSGRSSGTETFYTPLQQRSVGIRLRQQTPQAVVNVAVGGKNSTRRKHHLLSPLRAGSGYALLYQQTPTEQHTFN